jgi:DNA-binding transcriptional MerR regulator/methylmalonyl-CoA mutase cobalamin-binding subunit
MSAENPIAEIKKVFPIGYVALATGLSPHVIRVWERRYRAVAPVREGKKRRLYSQNDIDRLKLLKRSCMQGHRIGSVAMLDEGALHRMDRNDQSAFFSSKLKNDRSQPFDDPFELLCACESAVRHMDAQALLLTLRRADTRLSRASLLIEVVAPFMKMVGDEWYAKSLGIMHEHFASNVVRGFLSDLLDQGTPDEHAPYMVVTTPAGQHCEMGAMAAGAVATGIGWKVFYFGSDLPSKEIAAAAASKRAEAVCLSITCSPQEDTMSRELNRLRRQLGRDVRVFIGGRAAAGYERTVTAPNFHFFSSLSEFAGFISRSRSV